MNLHQLRCAVMVADELNFGRAARRLGLLPSALSRHVRLLEDQLGTLLFVRTTRHVALTNDGAAFIEEARALLLRADSLAERFRARGRNRAGALKVGVMDTAAAGLMPMLLKDLKNQGSRIAVELLEDKTIRLLPRLLSGRLHLVIGRPPAEADRRIDRLFLFHESAVVAVPARHRLAARSQITIADLAHEPMILPDRRARPHSHDLTIKLFEMAGFTPTIAQVAEEKQTIVNLVAARLGVAIVPRWTARMAVPGVRYLKLRQPKGQTVDMLPLAAMWLRGSADSARDEVVALLRTRMNCYGRTA